MSKNLTLLTLFRLVKSCYKTSISILTKDRRPAAGSALGTNALQTVLFYNNIDRCIKIAWTNAIFVFITYAQLTIMKDVG